jgi:transcriptional regulator GlxA family with amidase domain
LSLILQTAGGLTSGVDLALHIVARYYGVEVAQATAIFLEYHSELWKNSEYDQVKQAAGRANSSCHRASNSASAGGAILAIWC